MNRRTTGIVIALVGIVVVVITILSFQQVISKRLVQPEQLEVPVPAAVEEIVVTTRDVEAGQVLRVDDLEKINIPVEAVPWGALSEIENVVGRLTKVPLISGEMILSHHMADPTNISGDIGYFIGEDQVLMAFPASGLMSNLNIFKRGDLVDLLVSMEQVVKVEEVTVTEEEGVITGEEEEEEQMRFVTFNAMQAMELEAVIVDVTYKEENQEAAVPLTSIQNQEEGEGGEGEGGEDEDGEDEDGEAQQAPGRRPSGFIIRAYLLAVHPQDALVLKHLLDIGAQFDMVLRAPNNYKQFDLQPVVPDYLIDRFGLVVRE